MAQFAFEFDFEHWRELAERDPAAFFAARASVLQDFIACAPARLHPELSALQTVVDMTRVEAGTPEKATERIMDLMGDYLGALASHMADLQEQSANIATMLPRGE